MSVVKFSRLFTITVCLVLLLSQAEAGTYVDNKDGTITDNASSLIWQKSDDGVERTWDDAVAYCEDLKLAGHEDWILPDIQMLENLIDNAFSPTVNPAFSVRLSYYWSATEGREVNSAKYINFFYGNTFSFIKDNTYYTICALDVSASQAEPMLVRVESDIATLVAPFQVQFSATISGGSDPYFIEWDFNDGEFSSLSKPSHSFMEAGVYHVVVTVSDNDGAIAVGRQELTISASNELKSVPQEVESKTESASTPVPESILNGDDNDTSEDTSTLADTISTLADNVTSDDNATATETAVETVIEMVAEPATETVIETVAEAITETATETEVGESEKVEVADFEQGTASEKMIAIIADDSAPLDDENGTVTVAKEELYNEVEAELQDTDVAAEVIAGNENAADSSDDEDESIVITPGYLKIFASNDPTLGQMPGGKEGVLVYSFGNGLRGDADWNKDGTVTARELKGYLGIAIENLSQGKQKAVMNMSENDFPVCADGGTTHLLAVGADLLKADGVASLPFAAHSAKAIGQLITEKCSSWKQLVLTGKETARNNVLRALLKMRRNVSSKDNFIFYYAGPSEGSEQGLNLYTYDTLSELPDMTGLDYDALAALLDESEAANILMLFEVGSNAHE